jgi:uncharacterized membrane protein
VKSSSLEPRLSIPRFLVHILLVVYALVLAIVIYGLITPNIPPTVVFFLLSFVLLFFTVGQAIYEMGLKKSFYFFLVTATVGFFFELLGTNTGVPFGRYYYGSRLGGELFGVPVVVSLVWFVIAYLAFSLAFKDFTSEPSRLTKDKFSELALVALTAFGAVAWDLMIDPMFSSPSYQYWVWESQGLSLPSVSGVPISNFIGWFVVLFAMLIVFLIAVPLSGPILNRQNTWDTRIVYALLMVDGIFANESLKNYFAIYLGVASMVAFLLICFAVGKTMKDKKVSYSSIAPPP